LTINQEPMLRAILIAAGVLCLVALIHAAEQQVPESYQKMKNPLKPTKEVLESGRQLYKQAACAGCHGKQGKGDGADVKKLNLKPPPANFTTEQFAKNSDQYIFWRLSEGVPKTEMGGFKDVIKSEKDRWSLVLFIRSLNPKTAQGKK
jgi:high-affinity iron transporter